MKKPNIVLITFDSTRADRLGVAGYPKNLTPFLDSLAFSTGPGSPHSFVAILTSTYPFDYGGFEYIDRPRMLVSEVLQSAGYKTIGVHSAAYMSAYFGYDRGWDKLAYLSNFKSGEVIPGIRRDSWQAKFLKKLTAIHRLLNKKSSLMNRIFLVIEKILFTFRKIFVDIFRFRPAFIIAEDVNKEVKRLIPSKPREPLFLWVHYMDPHGPYAVFWKIKGTITQKMKYFVCDIIPFIFGQASFITRALLPLLNDAYDSSIKYTDQNIESLFKYLSSIGVVNDDSLVVICSDHGEEFFDHGNIGHLATLYNVNLNVPLIFYGPKYLPRIASVERPVSLMDISPTILDIAGVTKPKVFKGRNIFDAKMRPIIGQVPETEDDLSNQTFLGATVIHEGYKLIHMIDKKMLFSMENDFEEKVNLYDKEKEIVARLEKILQPYERILSH
jgi:arylsulfatase A-like enzyme